MVVITGDLFKCVHLGTPSPDIWLWSLKLEVCTVSKQAVHILLEYFLVTGRNKVVAKVIFLHLFVILFTGRGGLPQCMLGYHPPGAIPSWSNTTPPGTDTPTLGPDPPRTRPPPGTDTPLGADPLYVMREPQKFI